MYDMVVSLYFSKAGYSIVSFTVTGGSLPDRVV